MPSPAQPSQKKYWYKISVDSLRLWGAFIALTFVGIGGYWGYGLLQRHILERQVDVAIEEATHLLERLAGEKGLAPYRGEYQDAEGSLEKAKLTATTGDLDEALTSAERSRTLLQSIQDALRQRSPAGEAQFIAVQGGVEYRRGERGEWRQARGRVVLYPGDYVKTSSGGSAEVMTVDGSLFTVRPDTVILVARSSPEAEASGERTIALESGWVDLSTSRTASRITTPGAEARVSHRSQAVVTYDESKREGRFAAIEGGMEVTTPDGQKRRIGELEQVVQTAESLSQARPLPQAPLILGPEDNFEVSRAASDRLVLTWEPVDGAVGYSLQISRNRLFVDNIIDVEGRTKTRATVGLRGAGAFLWRVAATDAQGTQSPWTSPRRFRVSAAAAAAEQASRPRAPEEGGSAAGERPAEGPA